MGQNALMAVLNIMNNLEREAIGNIDFRVYITALFKGSKNIEFDVWNFIRSHIEYRSDMYDETIISPAKILFLKYGDCDDFALLAKSILNVFGIDSKYILFAKKENQFTHIAILCNNILIDPTNNYFNQFPVQYKFSKII